MPVVGTENFSDLDFVDQTFSFISDMKTAHYDKGYSVQIYLVGSSDAAAVDMLKSDGFGFGYDFVKNNVIFE